MLRVSIEHVRISILEVEENRPLLRFDLEGQITRPWDRGTIDDLSSTANVAKQHKHRIDEQASISGSCHRTCLHDLPDQT